MDNDKYEEFEVFDEWENLFGRSIELEDTVTEKTPTRADKAADTKNRKHGWIEAYHTKKEYVEEEGSILTQMKVSLVTMMFSFADFCGIEEVYSTQYAQNFWQNTTDKIEMRRRKNAKDEINTSSFRVATGGGER